MAWLKDRSFQIPNGLTFYVPELDWRPRQFSSFSGIVDSLYHLVLANPEKLGAYPKDKASLENLVDQYNAQLCEQNGWNQYLRSPGGDSVVVPFPQPPPSPTALPPQPPPPSSKLRNVAEGAETIVDWVRSGANAVDRPLAESRAAVCSDCPMNGKGGLERFFTLPASRAILAAVNAQRGEKLFTSKDELLGVCTACSCPLKLKVHFRIEDLKVNLDDEMIRRLDPRCWIPKELNQAIVRNLRLAHDAVFKPLE